MKATFDCLTLRSNRTYLLCIHIYIYICVCVCIYVRTSGHGGDGGDGDGGGGDGGDGGDDGGFSFPHLLSSPVSPRRGITWPKTWISFSLSICLSIYLFFFLFFFVGRGFETLFETVWGQNFDDAREEEIRSKRGAKVEKI